MLEFFDPEQFEQREQSCIGKNYDFIKIYPYDENNKVNSSFLLYNVSRTN